MRSPASIEVIICAIVISHAIFYRSTKSFSAATNVSTHPEGELRLAEGAEANFACASEDPLVTTLEWVFLNKTDFDLWPYSVAGRVLLQRVLHNFTGLYECRAFTGRYCLGTAHLKLTVVRPLRVETFQTWTNEKYVTLTCTVQSDVQPINVTWLWQKYRVEEFAEVFKTNNDSAGRFSLVVDVTVDPFGRGEFLCVAANDFNQTALGKLQLPISSAVPRIETIRSKNGAALLRLRLKKEFCGKRIDVVYWPSMENGHHVDGSEVTKAALPAMTSVPCRAPDTFRALKQLLTGYVDVVISPQKQWNLKANTVYFAEATALDETGLAGPSMRFTFETMDEDDDDALSMSPPKPQCLIIVFVSMLMNTAVTLTSWIL